MAINIEKIKELGYQVNTQNNEDVYVIERFCEAELCRSAVNLSHSLMKELPHRAETDGTFYSFDVLPQNTETNRIFRTIQFNDFNGDLSDSPIDNIFSSMRGFQENFVTNETSIGKEKKRYPQIVNYPKGGGFFDWHEHPRLPVNYGMILNLSERNKNFDVGATEIISSAGDVICVEELCDIGDLILFKYDLRHRVAPCNPNDDLIFDTNGRWTAILPIY